MDPSSKNLGWAILDEAAVYNAGLIHSEQEDKGFRFLEMADAFLPIFEEAIERDVHLVVIEEYVSKSAFGTSAVKGIIGVMQYIIARKGFKGTFIHPSSVKLLVTGNGRAEKDEVAAAVYSEYPFSSTQYTDNNVTDAIAIGIAAFRKIAKEEETIDKIKALAELNDGKLSAVSIHRSKILKTKKEATYIMAILKSRYQTEAHLKQTIFKLPWMENE